MNCSLHNEAVADEFRTLTIPGMRGVSLTPPRSFVPATGGHIVGAPLELRPTTLGRDTSPGLCFAALFFAEPGSTSAESALARQKSRLTVGVDRRIVDGEIRPASRQKLRAGDGREDGPGSRRGGLGGDRGCGGQLSADPGHVHLGESSPPPPSRRPAGRRARRPSCCRGTFGCHSGAPRGTCRGSAADRRPDPNMRPIRPPGQRTHLPGSAAPPPPPGQPCRGNNSGCSPP